MKLSFSKGVNSKHKVELEAKLVAVRWLPQIAYAGQSTPWQVRTVGVGIGAPIKVTGKSLNGSKLGSVKGTVKNNQFSGSFLIPEDIEPGDQVILQAELSKNSLDGESLPIPVRPMVSAGNLKWDKEEVKRDEIVIMTADIRGLDSGETVEVRVYEHDAGGAHDKVLSLDGMVKDNRMELQWAFEYFDNTEDIPDDDDLEPRGGSYQPPKYFFTVVAGNKEYGRDDQASGLLAFSDDAAFQFVDEDGLPLADQDFTIRFGDRNTKDGKTDSEGWARLKELPPGKMEVDFPNAGRFIIDPEENG